MKVSLANLLLAAAVTFSGGRGADPDPAPHIPGRTRPRTGTEAGPLYTTAGSFGKGETQREAQHA